MSSSTKGDPPTGTTAFNPVDVAGVTVQVSGVSVDVTAHNKPAIPGSDTHMLLPTFASLSLAGSYMGSSVHPLTKRGSFSVNASTAPGEMLYALTISANGYGDTTEITIEARKAMMRLLQVTSQLYRDVLEKCSTIINAMDLDDPETKQQAILRLRDVLEPFSSVVSAVFQGLLQIQKSRPDVSAFLLTDVLPALGAVDTETVLEVIRNVLVGAPPSMRLAAMEALDIIGVVEAKRLMAFVYPDEKNHLIRNFIDASLRAG